MDITLPEIQTTAYQVKAGQASLSREELKDVLSFLKPLAYCAIFAWFTVKITREIATAWISSRSVPAS